MLEALNRVDWEKSELLPVIVQEQTTNGINDFSHFTPNGAVSYRGSVNPSFPSRGRGQLEEVSGSPNHVTNNSTFLRDHRDRLRDHRDRAQGWESVC